MNKQLTQIAVSFFFHQPMGIQKPYFKKVLYAKIRTVGAKELAVYGRNLDTRKGVKKVIASIDLCPTKVRLSEGRP